MYSEKWMNLFNIKNKYYVFRLFVNNFLALLLYEINFLSIFYMIKFLQILITSVRI